MKDLKDFKIIKEFEKITLTKSEYKLLKSIKYRKIIINEVSVKIPLYKYGLIDHDFSQPNIQNQFIISDSGRRFLIWYKKHIFKTYAPIVISCLALLLSLISIIFSIIGLM